LGSNTGLRVDVSGRRGCYQLVPCCCLDARTHPFGTVNCA
jgi:hypothetical protein